MTPPTVGRSLSGTGTAAGTTPVVQALATQATAGSAVSGTEAQESGIAFTGADVATLVLTAATLIGVGLVLARRARPRAVVET